MAYGYGNSSSSRGKYGAPVKKREDGALDGFFDFVGNLAGDVRDAAVGLPTGFVMLVKDPKTSLVEMGKASWQTYSPLFHGDPEKFWHQFVEHPLAPLLDVAAIATLGLGAPVTAGAKVAQGFGAVAKTSRLVRLGTASRKVVDVAGQPHAYRNYRANPVIRARQKGVEAFTAGLAEHLPNWFGRPLAEDGSRILKSDGKTPKSAHIRDFSDAGFVDRYQNKKHSQRKAGKRAVTAQAQAAFQASMARFVQAGEDISKHPHETFQLIDEHMSRGLLGNADAIFEGSLKPGGKYGKQLDKEFTFVLDPTHIKPRPKKVTTQADYDSALRGWARRHTTRDYRKAAKNEDGSLKVVHNHSAKRWAQEAGNSSDFVRKLYQRPTQMWKFMVLATRPAYFVNNAVGNSAMYMMTFGGQGAFRGLVDAIRQTHGEKAAARSMDAAEKSLHKLQGDWVDQHFLDALQGYGTEALEALEVKGSSRKRRVANKAAQGLYPITHKYADLFLRRAAISTVVRSMPEVKALMKKGDSFDEAAAKVVKNPGVRDRVTELVNDAMGDYNHLNNAERALRQLVPFYTWDRAILRHGKDLALNHPAKAAGLAQLGYLGTAETEQLLGDVPDFLKGAVPLELLGMAREDDDGRLNVLTTSGLNPYASIPDLVDAARFVTGVGGDAKVSDSFASQINPLVTGAIEGITGQDLVTGARLPDKSFLRSVSVEPFVQTPPAQLIKTLIGGTPESKPDANGNTKEFLYKRDRRQQVSSFIGAPLRQVDSTRAAELARRDRGEKKPKPVYPF